MTCVETEITLPGTSGELSAPPDILSLDITPVAAVDRVSTAHSIHTEWSGGTTMNAMQHAQRDQPCIAIINTSEETLQLLQELMMDAGFATVSAYVPEFKRGERD